jgi:cytochrome c oxidase subunit 2
VGPVAKTIGVFYLVLIVISVLFAVGVAWSTLARPRLKANPERLAHRERVWMVVVLLMLAGLLFSTIFFTPYGESAGANKQVVRVIASQFAWDIRPDAVEIGRPVEFRLTASDVNHGFGLYDANDVLLAQVQIPLGHEQRLVYTFDEPGTYQILCLEFCGLGHHVMDTTIEATRG